MCVLDTFWTNPQYRVEVTDVDDDDDENLGTLIVALMQKNRRKLKKEGQDVLTIGYAIYKVGMELTSTNSSHSSHQGNNILRRFSHLSGFVLSCIVYT